MKLEDVKKVYETLNFSEKEEYLAFVFRRQPEAQKTFVSGEKMDADIVLYFLDIILKEKEESLQTYASRLVRDILAKTANLYTEEELNDIKKKIFNIVSDKNISSSVRSESLWILDVISLKDEDLQKIHQIILNDDYEYVKLRGFNIFRNYMFKDYVIEIVNSFSDDPILKKLAKLYLKEIRER